ncbi:uncharacterized protein EDB91DRAFT_792741 [Suillus paluster]|uniref:uncharacterized protein n=1 Tax=Suillus paluster TaxID=48578 RepID=UPI001B864488|nr:uncharacterized protein EDB91DRAFT_792741 [Suillus paluster]KAG1730102.1 hypothetical protein EDB91DRAFT_792741 [Suillus paluster]
MISIDVLSARKRELGHRVRCVILVLAAFKVARAIVLQKLFEYCTLGYLIQGICSARIQPQGPQLDRTARTLRPSRELTLVEAYAGPLRSYYSFLPSIRWPYLYSLHIRSAHQHSCDHLLSRTECCLNAVLITTTRLCIDAALANST